jgi:Tol biopolymer transport system component
MIKKLWLAETILIIIIVIALTCSGCNGRPSSNSPVSQPSVISSPLSSLTPLTTPLQPTRMSPIKTAKCRIVFVSQFGQYNSNFPNAYCQIAIMNDDGSNQEIILETKNRITVASCSPDGTRIAYSEKSYYAEVNIIDANGINYGHSDTHLSFVENIAWSPDGSKIAYVDLPLMSNKSIYIMNSDGSNQKKLTTDITDEWNPSWSPDSKKIAFARGPGFGDPMSSTPTGIFAMNSDGTNRTLLAGGWYPNWSPDGKKIAYSNIRNYRSPDGNSIIAASISLFVVNSDGTGQIQITSGSNIDDTFANWSPDGSKIAFFSRHAFSDKRELCVMNSDGSDLIKISDKASGITAAWSADSKKLVFSSDRDAISQIYISNADGSNQVRITNNTAINSNISWP